MSDIKKRKVDEFITKARSKSSPGNDGVLHQVYKKCPRLRNSLFLLLRNMWERKSVAKRWEMADGIYLSKDKKSETFGQFRSISLLNIDGKIMFGIIAKRIISFVRNNGYVDESVMKAGITQIPGCVEHTYAIWEEIRSAKEEKSDISVIWLDLANAYGAVPHAMLCYDAQCHFFWFPNELQKMIMSYYNNFQMRFTTGTFTTDWQRLDKEISASCIISVVLFILVMETMLKSADIEAFMNDIIVLVKCEEDTNRVLRRVDQLIT